MARRLGETAGRAAAGRSDLRAVEAQLADDVVDLQLARERAHLAAGGAVRAADDPPFKGLAPFDVDDADVFFGRERLVAEMVARLAGANLLGVVGPSGSGKSSAVRAGLLPALASGVLPGSDRWLRALLRPSAYPVRELDRSMWAAFPEAVRNRLAGTELPLRAVREALGDGERVLVVIDQFEEVFTACDDEDERVAFVRALTEAARDPGGKAVVVLAVRADFYGRCAAYPELADLLGANHVLVGPMTKDEYRRAIERPAQMAGLRVDPVLVDALVEEVAGEPGALPLLSTALLELWQHREGRNIPYSVYAATGGVRGAVARQAETAYGELTGRQRDVTRAIMLRLAGPGEGDAVVRRRVPVAELDRERDDDVRAALETLTRHRLVTVSEGFVEVAHEALLREWPRLQEWLADDRAGLVIRQHMTESAREWSTGGRDAGELYRGTRLASAIDWTAGHTLELNELEREFLAESRAASEREAERQRRTNRRLRTLLAGVAVFLVLALLAGSLALIQRGNAREQAARAEQEATTALAQRLGAQALVAKDLDLSLLLAREGVRLDDSPETRANLFAALQRSPAAIGIERPLPGRLLQADASPDGKLLLVVNNDSEVAFIDAETREVVGTTRADLARFAGEGHHVMTIFGPNAEVVDPLTGEVLSSRMLDGGWSGVSFSPDLSTIVLALVDRLEFLDVTTGATREVPAPEGIRFDDVTWAPTGDHLLTMGFTEPDSPDPMASPVRWSWVAIDPFRVLRSVTGSAFITSIAPDASQLAIGTVEGSIEIVDLDTGDRRFLEGRHNGSVQGVTWAPDGRTLITAGDDGQVIVWDTKEGGIVETWEGHNGRAIGLAVSPDGRTVYSASLDGSLMLWDLAGSRRLGRTFPSGPGELPFFAHHMAVSPTGDRFAVGRADGAVEVRDLRTLRELFELPSADGPLLNVVFSPDGRRLATTTHPGAVTVWSAVNGAKVADVDFETEPLVNGGENDVEGLAFSPDGSVLAGGDDLRRLYRWDAGTGALQGTPMVVPLDPALPPNEQGVLGVAFSPDGSMLAAGYGSLASWWRLSDGRRLATVNVDDGYGLANALAFSPDGRTLATGGGIGEVRFWDAGTGDRATRPIVAIAGWVLSLEYMPDGSGFLVAGTDGTSRIVDVDSGRILWSVNPRENAGAQAGLAADASSVVVAYGEGGQGFVWSLDPGAWEDQACAVAGRELSRAEWERYLPERPYASVCGGPTGGE